MNKAFPYKYTRVHTMYNSASLSFRLIIFLLHAVSAIVMFLKSTSVLDGEGCSNIVYPTARMVAPDDSYFTALRPRSFELNVKRIKPRPENCEKGWCKAWDVPQYIDYISDSNLFVIGSSWNVIFTIAVFEWITASYALLYFDPFDTWIPLERGLVWGFQPMVVVALLWNFFLLVYMWAQRAAMNIPPNNAILFTVAIITTMILQNYMAVSKESETKGEKKAMNMQIDNFWNLKPRYRPVGDDFHEGSFIGKIETDAAGVIPRYLEYTVTAPLLLVSLYSGSIPFDMTWKSQAVLASLVACNALGIPLHHAVLNITDDKEKKPKDPAFQYSSVYFFVASWLSLVAAFYIFIWSMREFLLASPDATGMPGWVLVLVWAMLILYSFFGIIASYYYLPRMIWGWAIEQERWDWCYWGLDVCSLGIKLPVAWTIFMRGAVVACSQQVTC